MPKKKKKRKSKIEKRLEQERNGVFPASYMDRMEEDFCNLVESMWDQMLDEANKDSEDLTLHENISEFCAMGWNIQISHASIEEAQRYLSESVAPKFQQEPVITDIIEMTIILKDKYCPDYQVLIDETTVSMKDGKPVIHVKFYMEDFRQEVEQQAADIPHTDDFIDREAVDKALEGIPEDQMEDALLAEIKRQTDVYNNTPQAELEGLTPTEAFHRNRKK